MFAEMSERQRECRGHAQALQDAQHRENGETGRARQQRGRDRQDRQADQDAEPAIDLPAEDRDAEPCDRHAERAGIDRGAHRRRADAIGPGQGRQNRLRGEQIDHGQKCRQCDNEKARDDPG
jgi:hypothetical protein